MTPDPNSPLDANGLPTGYIQGPRFGEGTANTNYPAWRPGLTGGRTFLRLDRGPVLSRTSGDDPKAGLRRGPAFCFAAILGSASSVHAGH